MPLSVKLDEYCGVWNRRHPIEIALHFDA